MRRSAGGKMINEKVAEFRQQKRERCFTSSRCPFLLPSIFMTTKRSRERERKQTIVKSKYGWPDILRARLLKPFETERNNDSITLLVLSLSACGLFSTKQKFSDVTDNSIDYHGTHASIWQTIVNTCKVRNREHTYRRERERKWIMGDP